MLPAKKSASVAKITKPNAMDLGALKGDPPLSASVESKKTVPQSAPVSPATRNIREDAGVPVLARHVSSPVASKAAQQESLSRSSRTSGRSTPSPVSSPSAMAGSRGSTSLSASAPGEKVSMPTRAEPKIHLRGLTRAVWALTSLNKSVWRVRTSSDGVQARFKEMITDEGANRMRNLALTPLTNLADQRARNEVCAVAPGLYQTNWRGAEDAERLKGRGITHVLSMLDPSENPHPEQFTYLNLVFEDEDDQVLDKHLTRGMAFIREGCAAGGCVVHCAAGVSRSSSFVLAYLMSEYGWSLREAFHGLRERRPIAWPNPGFMGQLIIYESKMFGGRTSLTQADYDSWAEENQEAIQMARLVDRDKGWRNQAMSGAAEVIQHDDSSD